MVEVKGTAEIRAVRVDPAKIIRKRAPEAPPEPAEPIEAPVKRIEFQLQPKPKYPTFLAPEVELKDLPPSIPQIKTPLIIDIETTGTNPTNSRLICIGLKDPAKPAMKPIVILQDDEELMLAVFLKIWREGRYNQFIGYNNIFDFRYLFAKMCFYRMSGKEFFDASLVDVMQIYTQVKEAFVYGKNKQYKMEVWGEYLLGFKKPMTVKEMLKAYNDKDFEKVREYNSQDVEMTYLLYLLANYTTGKEIFHAGAQETVENPSTTKVNCLGCFQEHIVDKDMRDQACSVCGDKLPNA